MVKLIEKRNALIAEYDAIKAAKEAETDVEKRSFSREETEKLKSILAEVEKIDGQIEMEKAFEEKRNAKLDIVSKTQNLIEPKNDNKKIITEFRSFLSGSKGPGEKFTLPFEVFENRATVT